MIDFQDLEDRIASLERTVRNIGIGQELVVGSLSILGEQLLFVRADKDGDGDYDPLTAAAWENSTKDGSGTINLNTVFGVPTNARAVLVWLYMTDSVAGTLFRLKAKSTTTNSSLEPDTQVANVARREQGITPIASDGTIYYSFSAAVDIFYLRIVGWYI